MGNWTLEQEGRQAPRNLVKFSSAHHHHPQSSQQDLPVFCVLSFPKLNISEEPRVFPSVGRQCPQIAPAAAEIPRSNLDLGIPGPLCGTFLALAQLLGSHDLRLSQS